MIAVLSIGALAVGLALANPATASDAGYIYGVVQTVDGDEYEGQLRWGKEEAFWDDVFNATKVRNENLEYVDDEVLNRLRRREPWQNWGALFNRDRDKEFNHLFAVRFGDLAGLRIRGKRVVAEFRNGEQMELGDGSNDIGAQITVLDPTQGRSTLAWDRIRSIEFQETPARLTRKLGEPLYGVVSSREYEFTGRIQWDHDECLSIDELDGETEDGKVSIPFGEIASIRKYREGALVTMKSGGEQYLKGTNDVNSGNRGVLVKTKGFGSVKIGWDDFEEVTFQPSPGTGRGYDEFGSGRALSGAVATRNDDRISGRIVFDLDEAWDFELLQGMSGKTEYLIPFREIARIKPRSSRRCDVVLRNGTTVELVESQDVSARKHQGLLVFGESRRPRYVDWREVEEVVFR